MRFIDTLIIVCVLLGFIVMFGLGYILGFHNSDVVIEERLVVKEVPVVVEKTVEIQSTGLQTDIKRCYQVPYLGEKIDGEVCFE